MGKKLIFIVIFLVGIILGSTTTSYYKNKQLSSLSHQEKTICLDKLQESSRLYQSLKTNCPLPTNGSMYFNYQLTAGEQSEKILSISLESLTPNILADAIDLRLDFDKGIEIVEIINGDSFSLYPRKIIGDGYILITGVALSQKNEIQFAKPKTTFIKLKLKTSGLNSRPIISLNRQESKIYLSGNDILDLNRSFSRIEP